MSSLYCQNSTYSPARAPSSPHIRANPDVESSYLGELLEEKLKLAPFLRVLPFCSKLLNQEIFRASTMIPNHGFNDFDRVQRRSPSPFNPLDVLPDVDANGLIRWNGNSVWSPHQHERLGMPQGLPMDQWNTAPASPGSYITKKILRLDIPVNSFPNFNFVGRLLGPRGNSLKQVEASTGCHVFIRGQGSIKDIEMEESLRGSPGYEHLNDPLHILIEAELPGSIIDVRLRQAQEIIEELLKPVRLGMPQGLPMDQWNAAPASPSSFITKRILRLDIPINSFPNFNFVGRLLGPRGNSLKRVEASTGCRVFIRGRGSIKDPEKEESLRGRPGYEHLNEPLHILIEAELAASIIDVRLRQAQEIIEELLKPVDESQDLYKRQQLRELAMLNSSLKEDSPQPRSSVSPFNSNSMKRAKTGW